MNPAVALLHLRQDYFGEFSDVALKDIFRMGLDEQFAYLIINVSSHHGHHTRASSRYVCQARASFCLTACLDSQRDLGPFPGSHIPWFTNHHSQVRWSKCSQIRWFQRSCPLLPVMAATILCVWAVHAYPDSAESCAPRHGGGPQIFGAHVKATVAIH